MTELVKIDFISKKEVKFFNGSEILAIIKTKYSKMGVHVNTKITLAPGSGQTLSLLVLDILRCEIKIGEEKEDRQITPPSY